ncbi:MAG: exonuclease SbcCD subunit D [Alloprevotella sp.]|nr:exonuclease SbcCD subunit D [Alloprevotella sp.]
MKIIHTADWHLGNTFHGHNREEEHSHFLGWLLETLKIEKPDALLVTGDVFDTANPSAMAENMFYGFLHDATEAVPGIQVVVTAGNHDSGGRLEAPSELLRKHNVYVRGILRRDEKDNPDFDYHILPLSKRGESEASVVVFALPYLRSTDYPLKMSQEEGLRSVFQGMYKSLKKSDFKGLPIVVCAHFYAGGADICADEHSERLVVGGQDVADVNVVGKEAAYVALGHIHKVQQVGASAWYSGSALPMSFSEKSYSHGALLVNVEVDGEVQVSRLEYKPLRRLISIPDRGSVLAGEVIGELERLPKREKGDEGLTWPYLEIHVREKQPEPTLLAEVTQVLGERAVHFCRMLREIPPVENAADEAVSISDLQTLAPIEMAQRIFQGRYGEKMPESLVEKFREAAETAAEESI